VMHGDEPVDVMNYARSNPEFPHQSTADQFFSESQFESYRVLGRFTLTQMLKEGGFNKNNMPDSIEHFAAALWHKTSDNPSPKWLADLNWTQRVLNKITKRLSSITGA